MTFSGQGEERADSAHTSLAGWVTQCHLLFSVSVCWGQLICSLAFKQKKCALLLSIQEIRKSYFKTSKNRILEPPSVNTILSILTQRIISPSTQALEGWVGISFHACISLWPCGLIGRIPLGFKGPWSKKISSPVMLKHFSLVPHALRYRNRCSLKMGYVVEFVRVTADWS